MNTKATKKKQSKEKPARESPARESKEILTIDQCADRYQVSDRHWHRMTTTGKAPGPIRIGAAIRWRLQDLLDWEEAGCPEIN